MHVDSVYSFGKRRLPIWVVLKDLIRDSFLAQDWEKPRGAFKGKGVPSLSWLVDEMVSADSSREDALFDRFKKLNKGVMTNLDELIGKDIVFTDAVTLSKMDPKFLFGAAKKLGVSAPLTYESDPVREIFHEPYSNMNAQSDALILLSALNPAAYAGKIFWPVSFVPFPSIVSDDGRSLSFFLPSLIDGINDSLEGKIKFGSMKKSLDDLFLPKVGSFECNPATFNQRKLTDLFILHPLEFARRLEQLKQFTDEPEKLLREEISYDVFLKKEMTAVFYSKILERLDVNPVYFGAKGSAGKEILERACELSNKELSLPGIDGVMPQKTIYSHLDASALRLLDGRIVGRHAKKTKLFPVQVRSEKTSSDDLSLRACPFAPVWCEEVYDEKDSCARLENKVKACTKDLYDSMKDDKAIETLDIGRKWKELIRESHPNVCHLADFTSKRAKEIGFRISSAEQVAFKLSRGPNYEVWSSVDIIDDDLLEDDDNRRRKGRSSWYAERGNDVIFPFPLKEDKRSPFLRASTFNVKCHLAKAFGTLKLSDTSVDEISVFGTAVHYLMNGQFEGSSGFLLQEMLWKRLGLEPASRKDYTERHLWYERDGKVISGHPDCVLGKAQHPHSKVRDVIIVDYKTGRVTPYLRLGNIVQTASYGMAMVQRYPEFDFRNIYLCIVNTPRVGEEQTINIAKMRNDPEDKLYQRVVRFQNEALENVEKLFNDAGFLRDYKKEMLCAGACVHDGKSKTGCYGNHRSECEKMFNVLKDGENLTEYAQRVRDNGNSGQ